MKEKWGRLVQYGKNTYESIYQDGRLSEETKECPLIDLHQRMTAKYVIDSLNTFHLESIVFSDIDKGKTIVLWERAHP